MALNMEKIKKMRDEYNALLFILEGVMKQLSEAPYVLSEEDMGDHILKWQMEIKSKISELRSKLMKEYEKDSK